MGKAFFHFPVNSDLFGGFFSPFKIHLSLLFFNISYPLSLETGPHSFPVNNISNKRNSNLESHRQLRTILQFQRHKRDSYSFQQDSLQFPIYLRTRQKLVSLYLSNSWQFQVQRMRESYLKTSPTLPCSSSWHSDWYLQSDTHNSGCSRGGVIWIWAHL